jgi:hypothetical protein
LRRAPPDLPQPRSGFFGFTRRRWVGVGEAVRYGGAVALDQLVRPAGRRGLLRGFGGRKTRQEGDIGRAVEWSWSSSPASDCSS